MSETLNRYKFGCPCRLKSAVEIFTAFESHRSLHTVHWLWNKVLKNKTNVGFTHGNPEKMARDSLRAVEVTCTPERVGRRSWTRSKFMVTLDYPVTLTSRKFYEAQTVSPTLAYFLPILEGKLNHQFCMVSARSSGFSLGSQVEACTWDEGYHRKNKLCDESDTFLFLRSHRWERWGGSTSRFVIPGPCASVRGGMNPERLLHASLDLKIEAISFDLWLWGRSNFCRSKYQEVNCVPLFFSEHKLSGPMS